MKCMAVQGFSEACLISLLCEVSRFSNHYRIVNSIIVAACTCNIFYFPLLYTHSNLFTSMIMHAKCSPSVWGKAFSPLLCFLKWLHVDILYVLE